MALGNKMDGNMKLVIGVLMMFLAAFGLTGKIEMHPLISIGLGLTGSFIVFILGGESR